MGHAAMVAALLCVAVPAWAYTPTVSGSGLQVRWPGGFKFNLAGNPRNATGLPSQLLRDATVQGLQRWQTASQGATRFDYWQGEDTAIYEPNSEYNGLSSIYFASNQRGSGTPVSPNVLGITQVWYNTSNGAILEADIILNDRDYEFTNNPRDTSGPGSISSPAFSSHRTRVYLGNVITHEIGHAFGLSHSGAMQATMLYMESPEQARLGCDDISGIGSIYPNATSRALERAAIQGSVRNNLGSPVLGAQVTAISARRGTVLATALTEHGGNYTLRGLEPGSYFLMAEPFFAGPSALPAFYAGLENACPPGQIFNRAFLNQGASNALLEVGTAPGGISSAPQITVSCTGSRGGASVAENALSSSSSTAPVTFNPATSGTFFGYVDRLDSGTKYFSLREISGTLEIKALSYSLYSPTRTQLSLRDTRGNAINARRLDRAYEGNSGFTDLDSSLSVQNLPLGDYVLAVSGTPVSSSSYPGGQVPVDSVPFVVLTGVQNPAALTMTDIFPPNSRCAVSENFGPYTSPPGDPPRSTLLEEDSVGFCGSIQNRSSSNHGTPLSAIIGWFMPYVLALAIVRRLRSRPHPVILTVR
jgi:hypothetical protein